MADASHELRTPLALLRMELELALRQTRSKEELEEAIRSASVETERLSRLAEDLLVLAQADEGRLPVSPQRLGAAASLGRVCARFATAAAADGRELVVEVTPPELQLVGDEARLDQAVGNLVDNALRHGRGRVVVSAVGRDDEVEVHVRDEGCFPADLRPRAFERFARMAGAHAGNGSGLGLAIVDVIARSHGGSANLGDGEKTDLWLRLPRR